MEEKKEYHIGRATLSLALGALGSRGVGFLREVVVAAKFGTGRAFDLYIAGTAFPNFLSTIFLYALPDYLIPYFARLKENRPAALRRFLLAAFLGGAVFLGLLYFSAPFFVRLFAPGLPQEEIPFGLRAFQILLLFIFGTSMEAILRSYYQVEGRFGLTAFSPFLSGLVVLASVFFLSGKFSVYALAWGWAIGSLVPVGVMLVFLFAGKKGTSNSSTVGSATFSPASYKDFSFILLLAVLGQLLPLTDRFFGSFLPPASLSAFYYASLLVLFPVGILVYPLGYAIFPKLSQKLSEGKKEEATGLLVKCLGWINFILIPVTVVLLLAPQEVVRLLFQRGAFDSNSAQLTSNCLRLLSFSLLVSGYTFVLTRVYLGAGKTKEMAFFFLGSFVAKVVFAILGIKLWGLLGLAGAASLGLIVLVGLQFGYLSKVVGNRVSVKYVRQAVMVTIVSLAAFIAARFGSGMVGAFHGTRHSLTFLGFFIFFFLSVSLVFRLPQLREGLKFFRSLMSKSRLSLCF